MASSVKAKILTHFGEVDHAGKAERILSDCAEETHCTAGHLRQSKGTEGFVRDRTQRDDRHAPQGKMRPTRARSPHRRSGTPTSEESCVDTAMPDAAAKSAAERPAVAGGTTEKSEVPTEARVNMDPACHKYGRLIALRHDPSGKFGNAS